MQEQEAQVLLVPRINIEQDLARRERNAPLGSPRSSSSR